MTYKINDIFTAIADPNRRRILGLLAEHAMSVNTIVHYFSMSRPAVSKHLKVLYMNNLVSIRRVGRERIYELNAEPLREVRNWIAQYEQFWDDRLQRLKKQRKL
jgi:DNA-binding transcriptional ArsR family regulator